MRYTPSGIPAINVVLLHESEVDELNSKRLVQADLKATALGVVAERLAKQTVGLEVMFKGFLTSPKKSLLFHIQEFELI